LNGHVVCLTGTKTGIYPQPPVDGSILQSRREVNAYVYARALPLNRKGKENGKRLPHLIEAMNTGGPNWHDHGFYTIHPTHLTMQAGTHIVLVSIGVELAQ